MFPPRPADFRFMATHQNSAQRRRTGRLLCQGLHIQDDHKFGGWVADVSATGMRVFSPEDPKCFSGPASFVLKGGEGVIEVVAECVWSRRADGDEGFEIGFRFVGLNDAARRQLFELFRNAAAA